MLGASWITRVDQWDPMAFHIKVVNKGSKKRSKNVVKYYPVILAVGPEILHFGPSGEYFIPNS